VAIVYCTVRASPVANGAPTRRRPHRPSMEKTTLPLYLPAPFRYFWPTRGDTPARQRVLAADARARPTVGRRCIHRRVGYGWSMPFFTSAGQTVIRVSQWGGKQQTAEMSQLCKSNGPESLILVRPPWGPAIIPSDSGR
jgi:hypothetical protein